jgi:hypothetical protein
MGKTNGFLKIFPETNEGQGPIQKKKGEHHKNHRSGIITRDRLEIFHLKM